VNNLPRVVARIMPRSESNPRPLDHESSALTTTPPSHLYQVAVSSCVQNQAPSYLIDCCGMSPVSLVTITCSQHVLQVHSSFLGSESFHLLLQHSGLCNPAVCCDTDSQDAHHTSASGLVHQCNPAGLYLISMETDDLNECTVILPLFLIDT